MGYGQDLRYMFTVAGAERSGKTYFAERFADRYSKKSPVIIFNPGRDTDFVEYKWLEFISNEQAEEIEEIPYERKYRTKEQQRRKINIDRRPTFIYFRLEGNIYSVKDINILLSKNKKVKISHLSTLKDKAKFFNTIFDYVSGALLINDDFRPIARNISNETLGGSLSNLFSRKNHAGQLARWRPAKKRVDIINIFHHPDKCNAEIYDYTTHIVLFSLTRDIRGLTIDNHDAAEAMKEAHKKLKKAPRFSYAIIYLKGNNANKHFLKKP